MDAMKTGERLFTEGKFSEAENFFQNIIRDNPRDKEAYNNLGVIALQKKDLDEALDYFTRALEIDPLYKIALLNYTEIAKAIKSPSAKIILKKYLDRYPADREVSEALVQFETVFQEKPKISFICLPTMDTFLGDIIKYFRTRCEVRTCISNDLKEIEAAIIWGDIIWLEWGNEMTIALTKQPQIFKYKRVICRLHSYEAINGYAQKINWEEIDDVIFVADHIRTLVQQQVPELAQKVNIHTVPNGIDLDRFQLTDKQRGKNIAFLGTVNFKKGPMLLLHAFRELLNKDDEYRLYIGGEFKDSRYSLYFSQMIRELGLENKIHLNGRIDDVPAWLKDKQYIVCSSPLEGHPVGLMEAMACGCKPIIHNFVGAGGLYPREYLWNSIDEFVGLITADDYNPTAYREFIEYNYSLLKQLTHLENIINDTGEKFIESEKETVTTSLENDPLPMTERQTYETATDWVYPNEMFSSDPKVRIETLTREAAVQIQQKRFDLAKTTLLRLAKMTRYTSESVNLNLVKIYQQDEDIPAIQNIFKRAAAAALSQNQMDNFLNYAYLSIYAENMFSPNPNYRYAWIDEDLNTYIRLAAKIHPLKEWVTNNRQPVRPYNDKIKIGFLLEGFSQNQAPTRTYYPLAEHYDRDKYEIYFYSRWSLTEDIAQRENYDITVDFLKKNDCHVVSPDRQMSPMEQVEFLTKQIVTDGIDLLTFQTTYFVPVYNFISCLHPAPFQALLEHQQSEFSQEMDLVFTTRKQVPECSASTAPGVIPMTRKETVNPHLPDEFAIPEGAVILISANRESRYYQNEFWTEMYAVLDRNPIVYFVAVGLSDTDKLPPMDPRIRSQIITPGYRTDVMEFFKMADIYIDLFPSGAGSSLIEALQAGLPVLCYDQDMSTLFSVNDISLGPDFIPGSDLVIPYGDRKKWHKTIDRLIYHSNYRNDMAFAMRKHAENFEPKRVATAFFNRLTETIRENKTALPVA